MIYNIYDRSALAQAHDTKRKKSVVACPVGIMLARFRPWGSGALGASFGWISSAQRARPSATRSSSSNPFLLPLLLILFPFLLLLPLRHLPPPKQSPPVEEEMMSLKRRREERE